MTRQLKPHGTQAAYQRHVRHHEPACDECLDANADDKNRRRSEHRDHAQQAERSPR